MPSRTFDIEDLEDVAYYNVLKEERHTGRWNVYSDVVFKADDDKLYVVSISEGLTEYQDTYGADRFPDCVRLDDEYFVECDEVELYTEPVPTTKWRAVK